MAFPVGQCRDVLIGAVAGKLQHGLPRVFGLHPRKKCEAFRCIAQGGQRFKSMPVQPVFPQIMQDGPAQMRAVYGALTGAFLAGLRI